MPTQRGSANPGGALPTPGVCCQHRGALPTRGAKSIQRVLCQHGGALPTPGVCCQHRGSLPTLGGLCQHGGSANTGIQVNTEGALPTQRGSANIGGGLCQHGGSSVGEQPACHRCTAPRLPGRPSLLLGMLTRSAESCPYRLSSSGYLTLSLRRDCSLPPRHVSVLSPGFRPRWHRHQMHRPAAQSCRKPPPWQSTECLVRLSSSPGQSDLSPLCGGSPRDVKRLMEAGWGPEPASF